MRIIIAGAGEVGRHLANLLAEESQDIILIDKDKDTLEEVSKRMDVITLEGNATSYEIMQQAQITRADLLLAVTASQEANLSIAMLGKRWGAKKTVARIRNIEFLAPERQEELRELGIDEVISPESLAAREISRLLKRSAATDTFEFEEGRLTLMGVTIGCESPALGHSLDSLKRENSSEQFIAAAIHRQHETIIPRGHHELREQDHAYFISCKDGVDYINQLAGQGQRKIKEVVILGGSAIGINTARRLGDSHDVKIIEKDYNKANHIADILPNVLVVHGDGSDTAMLEEEHIEGADAFIAVTGDTEVNILACLMAKNMGVMKTVALVENMAYIPLSQNIGIDTMINKKLIAANFIFRYIRKGQVVSLTSIHGVNAEVFEYEVSAKAKVTKKKIKDLNFPKDGIICGVIRDNVPMIAQGETRIQGGDKVVVLAMHKAIPKVERFF